MDLSKIFDKPMKIFISIILIAMTILCFLNTFCFAAEESETLTFERVNGIGTSSNANYFVADSSSSVGYIRMEKGYIYHFHFGGTAGGPRNLIICDDIPAVNVPYIYLTRIELGDSYDYLCTSDTNAIFGHSWFSPNFTVTREKIPGMTGAINDLVKAVAPSNLWDTFKVAIPYVGIVTLASFGFYYIFHTIKEISQGREN